MKTWKVIWNVLGIPEYKNYSHEDRLMHVASLPVWSNSGKSQMLRIQTTRISKHTVRSASNPLT